MKFVFMDGIIEQAGIFSTFLSPILQSYLKSPILQSYLAVLS